jgi:hypothetical protein
VYFIMKETITIATVFRRPQTVCARLEVTAAQRTVHVGVTDVCPTARQGEVSVSLALGTSSFVVPADRT